MRLGRLRTGWARVAPSRPELLLLPLLGLLLVVAVVFPDRYDDEAGYLELARNLIDGHYAAGRPDALLDADPAYPDLWFGPGLPLLLAGPVAVGLPLWLVRLTAPLLLFLACLVFFRLTKRYMRPRAALAATWTLGLYLPFYTVLPNLHSEPLAVLLVVVAMYATARLLEDGGRRWLALGAATLAGVALTRVAYGWVLTILLAVSVIWWALSRSRRARSLSAMVALALVLCAPWLAYTAAETGRVLQWGNSGSLSLYWMSSPFASDRGDWQQAHAVFTDPELAPHRPFFETLRDLPLPEQNARLERRALENIGQHPLKYAENVAANVSRMFFDAPYSSGGLRRGFLYFALSNTLLLAAALFSALALVRRRTSLPAPAAPFAIFALTAFSLHALVAAYPRMLMPIVPVVVWFGAISIAGHGARDRTTLTAPTGNADVSGMPHSRDSSPRARSRHLCRRVPEPGL